MKCEKLRGYHLISVVIDNYIAEVIINRQIMFMPVKFYPNHFINDLRSSTYEDE
ncbi:hypothetical protein BN1221_03097c [Brenneria goodwinii]|uniref:Uncharacterized protein n=1 Tax=Brenneria goodwinii TaxID=1109412 RepID=A0A0G4JXE8_9GAMM|nr:hypothetical protein BN1221_03097c [Brenneria goodwinii]